MAPIETTTVFTRLHPGAGREENVIIVGPGHRPLVLRAGTGAREARNG